MAFFLEKPIIDTTTLQYLCQALWGAVSSLPKGVLTEGEEDQGYGVFTEVAAC